MNILQLTGMASTKYGGLERYFVRLVRSDKDDHFIFVYDDCPIDTVYINDLTQAGGIIHTCSRVKRWIYFRTVYGLIKKERIDIVHFHFGSYEIAPILRCLFPNLKLIATCHSEIQISNVIRKMQRRFYQSAFNRILCVSEGVKKGLIKNVGESFKYEVLYLGVEKRPLQHKNLREELGISPDSIVFTTIGFNIRIKGLDILINAIRYLVDNYRFQFDFKVLIVGVQLNSEENIRLNKLIHEASLSNIIKSVGIRNDVDDFLSISDVYLQPSRTEAISLSIMEALSYALPVVATRVGGIPEVVHDKINGFLFENENSTQMADILHILISDKALRYKLGEKSLLLSKKYTLQKNLDCFIKYIRKFD